VELVSIFTMVAAGARVVHRLLDDEQSGKLVATLAGGIIGNRADGLLCKVAGGTLQHLRDLRTTDPLLNHDLERATREAFLLATAELLRQASIRLEVGGAGSQLRLSGAAESVAKLQAGLQRDRKDAANTLPEPVNDVHLFLLDPNIAPAERMLRLRTKLRQNLNADFARWLGEPERKSVFRRIAAVVGGGSAGNDNAAVPQVVEDLLESGWSIDTRYHKAVPRDWYSLIAIAFIEKLKSSTRLSAVFESRMLAEIATSEPKAASIATIQGFAEAMAGITAPLQEIEDSLNILKQDVKEIKEDIRDIKAILRDLQTQHAAALAREQLANERERRLFDELDRRDRDLRALHSDLHRSREDRAAALADLETVVAERAQLVQTIAERDRAYAVQIEAYRQQIAGFADNPSEELRAALERFAGGDRIGAFPVIEALTRAQNLAAERATAARNASRLREVAALALRMKDNGEKSTADVAALWEEAQMLDDSYHWGWVELRRLYTELGDLRKARSAADAAVRTSRDDRALSVSWNELGEVLVAQGDLAAARVRFSQFLSISENLARDNPSSAQAQRDLSVSFDKLGNVLVAQGDLAAARERFSQSLAIHEKWARDNPSIAAAQRDLSVSLNRLGDVLVAQGDLAAACERFSQSLSIDERLARDNPSSAAAQRDLSVSFDRLGDVLVAQGDLAAARDRFSQSLSIADKLARDNPSSAEAQRDLIVSYWKLAQVTGASEWWRRALAVASQLQEQGRLAPQDAWMIPELQKRVAAAAG
jgi:tetratricopeptide (TPR) repeat protein